MRANFKFFKTFKMRNIELLFLASFEPHKNVKLLLCKSEEMFLHFYKVLQKLHLPLIKFLSMEKGEHYKKGFIEV